MEKQKQQAEVRHLIYAEGKQYFIETSNLTDEIKSDYFRTKERTEKVIFSDNAVVVILDDGSKGVAKCMAEDEYNTTKGIKIAYIRAKIKSLMKELKGLIK